MLAGFLFLLVEKNGLCVGMFLFGGCLTGTGSTAVDAVCLALIKFKAEVTSAFTSCMAFRSVVMWR